MNARNSRRITRKFKCFVSIQQIACQNVSIRLLLLICSTVVLCVVIQQLVLHSTCHGSVNVVLADFTNYQSQQTELCRAVSLHKSRQTCLARPHVSTCWFLAKYSLQTLSASYGEGPQLDARQRSAVRASAAIPGIQLQCTLCQPAALHTAIYTVTKTASTCVGSENSFSGFILDF